MKVAILNRFIVAAALGVAATLNVALATAADVAVTSPALVVPDSTVDIWKMIDAKVTDIHAVIDVTTGRQLLVAKDKSDYLNVKQATSNIKDLVLALPVRIDGKDANHDIVERDANAAASKAEKLLQAIDDPLNHPMWKALAKLEESLTTLRAYYPNGTYKSSTP